MDSRIKNRIDSFQIYINNSFNILEDLLVKKNDDALLEETFIKLSQQLHTTILNEEDFLSGYFEGKICEYIKEKGLYNYEEQIFDDLNNSGIIASPRFFEKRGITHEPLIYSRKSFNQNYRQLTQNHEQMINASEEYIDRWEFYNNMFGEKSKYNISVTEK